MAELEGILLHTGKERREEVLEVSGGVARAWVQRHLYKVSWHQINQWRMR